MDYASKKVISDLLDSCYAVARLTNQQEDFLLAASETEDACFAYNLNKSFEKTIVWENVGGTMSIVQIPGTMDFLATQKFYPGFNAQKCQLVYGKFSNGNWVIEKIANFPYLHRFDVIEDQNGRLLFVGCTIANSKKSVEDWKDKGRIFVGEFNLKRLTLEKITELPLVLLKNHGYYAVKAEGYSLITSAEGIFKLTYPNFSDTGNWQIEPLFYEETSDIVKVDIDQDGMDEYVLIQGFHGEHLRVLDNQFQKERYSYTNATPFGHAIWAGTLLGKAVFIFGWRADQAQLRIFYFSKEEIQSALIDDLVMSSNVLAFEKNQQAYLFSANNGKGEVALYEIKSW